MMVMKMYNLFNCFPPKKGWLILLVIILSILIIYQAIITIIIPFRFNVFILLCEILLLFYILWRIIWDN